MRHQKVSERRDDSEMLEGTGIEFLNVTPVPGEYSGSETPDSAVQRLLNQVKATDPVNTVPVPSPDLVSPKQTIEPTLLEVQKPASQSNFVPERTTSSSRGWRLPVAVFATASLVFGSNWGVVLFFEKRTES